MNQAQTEDHTPFVPHTSIVRHIWGSADIILFIFAGASAEVLRSLDDPARWGADAIAEAPEDLWPLIERWAGGDLIRRP